MLVRLLPQQIEARWDWMRPLLMRSLVPTVIPESKDMVRVLRELFLNNLVAWVYVDEDNGNEVALVLTSVWQDQHTLYRNLVIYSLNVLGVARPGMIEDMFTTLRVYAKSQGCGMIVAYTSHERLLNIATRAGADTSVHLIKLEV